MTKHPNVLEMRGLRVEAVGGTLQRDVATQAELNAVGDPDGHQRVTKDNALNNGEARPRSRAPDA